MAANKTSSDNPFSRTFEDYNHRDMKNKVHVSSLKIMDGEDLSFGNRKRLQQLQQKDWIDQQMSEKQERNNYLNQTHQSYADQSKHINNMAIALEDAEKHKRRTLEQSCKQYNMQLANEKFDKNRDEHNQEQVNNQQHINYCTNNDFQTENTKTCKSFLKSSSRHEYIPYHWKGLDDQEQKDIKLMQEQQEAEQQMLARQKKEEEKLYAIQAEEQRFMNINIERERVRQHKKKLDEIKEYNLLAAKEQKLKLKTMYD